MRESLDGARPRPVGGEVVDLVEHEERLRLPAVVDERVVAALARGVLVRRHDHLDVEVLEEHPVRVRHAEADGRGSEVVEDARELVAVGVLVAEVAAGDEHHEAVRDAERPGDEEARERGDGLAVARHEDAERVPLVGLERLGPGAQEGGLPVAEREAVAQLDAGDRGGRLGDGCRGGARRRGESGGRRHGRSVPGAVNLRPGPGPPPCHRARRQQNQRGRLVEARSSRPWSTLSAFRRSKRMSPAS